MKGKAVFKNLGCNVSDSENSGVSSNESERESKCPHESTTSDKLETPCEDSIPDCQIDKLPMVESKFNEAMKH